MDKRISISGEELVVKAERYTELLKEANVLVDKLASMKFEITLDLKKSNTDATNETENLSTEMIKPEKNVTRIKATKLLNDQLKTL